MKRISLLCLMLFLVACGSETDTGLGMLNQPPSLTIKEQTAYRYQVSLQNASQDAVITINNLPAWAEFDAEENVISGTPEHTDADQEYTYSISVEDGDELFQSDDVTIRVEHSTLAINTLPLSRSYVRELSEFSQTVSVDSDLQSLTYSLLNAPEWMSIDEQGRISGTPTHKYLGETHDSIYVQISDGTHEVLSDAFEVSVVEILNLSPRISVSSNVDGDFHINQDMVLTFDELVYINTISVAAPSGACVSNIQISDDDFSTCIQLHTIIEEPEYKYPDEDSSKTDAENEQAKEDEKARAEKVAWEKNQLLISTKNLEMNKEYKLRMTSHVLDGFDFSLESDYDSTFYTVAGLMVTEVGSKAADYGQHWFEVYNATGQTIDLQDYKLRSQSVTSAGCDAEAGLGCVIADETEFPFNSKTVAPGEYIIVREDDWAVPQDDTANTTYIGNSVFPYWGSGGYIELINVAENKTDDYVRFGSWFGLDVHTPLSEGAWVGDNHQTAAPSFNQNSLFLGSIGRAGGLFDSNSTEDWFLYDRHTAGFTNSIALDDGDLDGIPDYMEAEGVVYAGMELYKLGARQGVKDIFVELDYMDSDDIAVTPRIEALEKVVGAFAAQNIAVHFDVGDLFSSTYLEDFNLGGGNQVDSYSGITFTPNFLDARTDFYDIKRSNINPERLPIFHYFLMAQSQEESLSSGGSEQSGNDAFITLGDWGLNLDDDKGENELINIQASIIMHQLGHNLGLKHGGDDFTELKPNYLSTMNPLYVLEGLATVGNNEGDRYYYQKYIEENLCHDQAYEDLGGGEFALQMTHSVSESYESFMINFSSTESSLNEASILEESGLNLEGSMPVDFDCSGESTDTLEEYDVNFNESFSELSQPADWSRVVLRFQGNESDDSPTITYEQPPSQDFLDRIQGL